MNLCFSILSLRNEIFFIIFGKYVAFKLNSISFPIFSTLAFSPSHSVRTFFSSHPTESNEALSKPSTSIATPRRTYQIKPNSDSMMMMPIIMIEKFN